MHLKKHKKREVTDYGFFLKQISLEIFSFLHNMRLNESLAFSSTAFFTHTNPSSYIICIHLV